MSWVPLAAWIAAFAVAVLVLGFCAYELRWKTQRLNADVGKLQALGAELVRLQGELAVVQQRAERARQSLPSHTT